MELHLTATGCHLPLWHHTVLLFTRHLNPGQTCWYSIYLPQRDGRLSWPRWPVRYQDDPPTDGHPSKY